MSPRGMAGAIKGSLLNIEMQRGMIFKLCQDYETQFTDVDVLQWKGQLSKVNTIRRIKKIAAKFKQDTKMLSKDGHDWDACGIGLFLQGVF